MAQYGQYSDERLAVVGSRFYPTIRRFYGQDMGPSSKAVMGHCEERIAIEHGLSRFDVAQIVKQELDGADVPVVLCDKCDGRGQVGRHEAAWVYCDCVAGLDAEMTAISKSLQRVAGYIADFDARSRSVGLFPAQVGYRKELQAEYDRLTQEHDDLERAWTKARERGESVPV